MRSTLYFIGTVLLFACIDLMAQTNPNLEQGLKPYGSYHGGNLDVVNLSNGNLTIKIPLLSYAQRGGKLDLAFFIRHNNKGYRLRSWTDQFGTHYQWQWYGNGVDIGREQDMGVGKTKIVGTDQTGNPYTIYICSITAEDGSTHQLGGSGISQCGSTKSIDASGYAVQGSTQLTAFNRNGLQQSTEVVTDPNGNQITWNSSGWTDTLGRLISGTGGSTTSEPSPGVSTSDYSGCPVSPTSAYVWNVPGPNGGTTTYKLCYLTYSYSTAFNMTNVQETSGTASLLQAVVLPNGTYWSFDYNSYLDVAALHFPTGGSISYTYTNLNNVWGSGSRAVVSRSMNDGTASNTWNYSYTFATNQQTTVVTDPAGNDTVHVFTDLNTDAPYETETRWYQGASSGTSGTLLKTLDTQYSYNSNPYDEYTGNGTVINAVATSRTTTWPNGKTSKVTSTYDSGNVFNFYDAFTNTTTIYPMTLGDVVSESEYGYGASSPGPLLRQTVNSYRWMNNSTYQSANLIDLLDSTITEDPAGARCAETDYTYDETAYLTGASITTQHITPASVRGNASKVTRWVASLAPGTNSCSTSSGWTTFDSHTNWYDTGEPYQSIDPLGHTTTYAYSSSFAGAYVTQTTMPSTSSPNAASHVVSGNYDFNTGLLTSFTDQNNQTSNYSYDTMFRITQALMPPDPNNGNMRPETDFYYPDVNDVERKQKIDSSRWTDTYVKFDGLGRESRRATSNDQSSSNGWDQTDTCYDNLGRVGYASYPYQNTGFNFSNPCTAPVEPGDRSAYDPLGRVHTITHSDNSVITTNYSGPSSQSIGEGNGSYSVQRVSQQDGLGRLISVCEVTSATLSGSGGAPAACSDDFGQTGFYTSYGYDPLGNLISVQQSGLANRSFSYDSLSRLTSAANPESGTTSYSYNNDGEVISRTRPQPNQGNAAVLLTTNYGYDELHRERSVSYTNDPTSTPGTTLNYDETTAWGGTPLSNSDGRLTTEYAGAAPGVAASMFSYDSNGRIVQNWQCTPRTCGTSSYNLSYGYDLLGDMTSSQNGVGVGLGYVYNAAARLITLTSSANDANHPGTLLSNVTYGPFGPSSLNLGNGVAESMTYHQRGWLQGQTDLSPTTTASASVSFSPSSGPDPSAQVQTSPGSQSSVAITINGAENSLCTDYIGSRCGAWAYDGGTVSATVNGCSVSANYDRSSTSSTIASALASGFSCGTVTASVSGATVTFTSTAYSSGANYAFSATSSTSDPADFASPSFWPSPTSGNMTGGADPTYTTVYDTGTANITVNGYNKAYTWGQNDTSSTIAANLASQFHNDPNAPADASSSGATVYLTSRTAGSGGNYSLSANMNHASTSSFPNSFFSESASGPNLSGGNNSSPLYQYQLAFEPDGDIQSANDSVNGNWTYGYDQFNRLLSSNKNSGAQAFSYGYDRFGNRWNQTITAGSGPQPAFSFTGSHNQIDGYTYDAAGNLRNDGCHAYTYDAENRVISASPVGTCTGSGSYVYDAEGRRVKRTGMENVEFLYDLAGHPVTQLDATNGNVDREEIYAAGRHIVSYYANTTFFDHADWLGTERARSNVSGALCQTNTSLPFGDGASSPVNTCNPTPDFFTGKPRDSESGLDFFGARYYNSAMARWMIADWAAHATAVPYADFGNPQSLNLYGYVGGNPIAHTDTDGHCAEAISCTIELGAVGSAFGPLGTVIGGVTGAVVGGVIGYYAGKAVVNHIQHANASKSQAKKGSANAEKAGKPFSQATKDKAREESVNKCVFCGKQTTREPGPDQSHIDHAIPKSRGGDNTIDNAQNTCKTCNVDKGTQTTEEYTSNNNKDAVSHYHVDPAEAPATAAQEEGAYPKRN